MGYHTKLDFAKETLSSQTRAERRRVKKAQEKDMQLITPKIAQEEKNLYTFTEQQLIAFMAAERQRAVKEVQLKWGESVCNIFLAAMRIVLHDKYQFGEKRLKEVSSMIEQQLDCVLAKCVTAEEMERAAKNLNDKAIYKR